jgi:hypothetical protein
MYQKEFHVGMRLVFMSLVSCEQLHIISLMNASLIRKRTILDIMKTWLKAVIGKKLIAA